MHVPLCHRGKVTESAEDFTGSLHGCLGRGTGLAYGMVAGKLNGTRLIVKRG